LQAAPFRAGDKAGVIDLAPIIETDVVRLLMAGFRQLLVKARAGHRRALGDGVRRSADLLDLILAHSRLDFGDQWQVAIEARFSAAAR
jgi:hypothetical protein